MGFDHEEFSRLPASSLIPELRPHTYYINIMGKEASYLSALEYQRAFSSRRA